MAKPEYRLQALLEIRERKKEEAEHALGDAMAAHKREQDKERQMELELERMIARREERRREYSEKAMRGEMSAQAVVASNGFIERLREQEIAQKEAIASQHEVVLQKEREVENARGVLVTATQDLKALEKHKEKFIEDWKKEMQAKEEDTMDELAQQMFLRK